MFILSLQSTRISSHPLISAYCFNKRYLKHALILSPNSLIEAFTGCHADSLTSPQSYRLSKVTVSPPAHHLHQFGEKKLKRTNCGVEQTCNYSWAPGKVEHRWRDTFSASWHPTWPACSSLEEGRPNGSNRGQDEKRRRRRRLKDGGSWRRRSEGDLIHRFALFIKNEGNRKWMLISVPCEKAR